MPPLAEIRADLPGARPATGVGVAVGVAVGGRVGAPRPWVRGAGVRVAAVGGAIGLRRRRRGRRHTNLKPAAGEHGQKQE